MHYPKNELKKKIKKKKSNDCYLNDRLVRLAYVH
jgi:hypothetical protein